MAKPIHMMVRVLDEARSVDFYQKAFGLEIATDRQQGQYRALQFG
jgi:lactoylglutathione lyase